MLRVVIFMQERRKTSLPHMSAKLKGRERGKKEVKRLLTFYLKAPAVMQPSVGCSFLFILMLCFTEGGSAAWAGSSQPEAWVTSTTQKLLGKKNKKIIFTHKLLVIFFFFNYSFELQFWVHFSEYMWVSKVKKLIWAIVEVVDSTFCNHLCSSVCESWSSTSLSEKWVLDSYVILL